MTDQAWQQATADVLADVLAERVRQVARYGTNEGQPDGTGPDTRWLMPVVDCARGSYTGPIDAKDIELLLREEYEDYDAEAPVTWLHLVREEVAEAFAEDDGAKLDAELIQVAALCVSWVTQLRARGHRLLPVEEGYR